MKKIYLQYLSFLLLISLFIILTNFIFFNYSNLSKSEAVSNSINLEKIAYLTFDDGPSENTIKILDILDKYEIQATFFVVGPSYKLKNDLLNEIIKRGHTLAMHSYNHEYSKIYANKDAYIDDFYNCLNWIKNVSGSSPVLYRFPGGSSTTIANKTMIQSIIETLYKDGYLHVDWNVDSFDSHYNNDTNAIITNTLNCIKTNESNNIYNQIILMHDNTKKVGTIKALPSIIENCLQKGYKFKSLSSKSTLIQHIKRP